MKKGMKSNVDRGYSERWRVEYGSLTGTWEDACLERIKPLSNKRWLSSKALWGVIWTDLLSEVGKHFGGG
jgi:hypothetical protein